MALQRRSIPLLKDWHTHPFLYAALEEGVNLNRGEADRKGTKEALRDRAIHRIRAHAQRGVPGWVIAFGWNSGLYDLFQQDFDDLEVPLVVFDLSLHGNFVNAAGRAHLGRVAPAIAENLGDQTWVETHLRSILNVFTSEGASVGRLQKHFRRLLEEDGVYHAEEMLLVDEAEIRLFEDAGLASRTRFWAAPEQYERLSPDLQEKVHGVKLFTDGALGSHTAALGRPFRKLPPAAAWDARGMLMYEQRVLEDILRKYLGVGKPVALHAIGDRAIDQVVSALEAVRRPSGGEVRIEHAQLISEQTAKRARDLGVILCMQPNFSEDSANYEDRLPDGYPERNNPFRMLIDQVGYTPGVDLLFGSDGMPHGFGYGLEQALFPMGRHRGQVLTLEEFVAGYCMPDVKAGHIELEIDSTERRVTGRVVLAQYGASAAGAVADGLLPREHGG